MTTLKATRSADGTKTWTGTRSGMVVTIDETPVADMTYYTWTVEDRGCVTFGADSELAVAVSNARGVVEHAEQAEASEAHSDMAMEDAASVFYGNGPKY